MLPLNLRCCSAKWQAFSLLFLLLATLAQSTGFAADKDTIQPSVYRQPGFWDGEFTDGSSGYPYGHPDPGSSEGKSGQKAKDWPYNFWIPPNRQFEDADPEELDEQEGRHYSPCAVLLLPVDAKYRSWKLAKGYYQVKLGQSNDGSPKTRLAPEDQMPFTPNLSNLKTPTYQPPTAVEKAKTKAKATFHWPWQPKPLMQEAEIAVQPDPFQPLQPLKQKDPFEEQRLHQRFVETLVLKKLGKVVAVLPVVSKKASPDKRKERWSFERKFRQPVAWVAPRPQGLWLYVNDGHTVFAAELDALSSP